MLNDEDFLSRLAQRVDYLAMRQSGFADASLPFAGPFDYSYTDCK